MTFPKVSARRLISRAKQYAHNPAIAAGIALLALTATAYIVQSQAHHQALPTHPSPTQSNAVHKVSAAAAPSDLEATNAPVAATTPASASSTKPTTGAVPQTATPGKSNGQLIANQTTFTVQVGQRLAGALTVRADSGETIAMPMGGTLLRAPGTAFPAGPDKPVWTGDITAGSMTTPGTYTISLVASAPQRRLYQTTITVIVIGQPYLDVQVRSTGATHSNGYREVLVYFTRVGGHSQPVTTAYIVASPGSAIECIATGQQNAYGIYFACDGTPGQTVQLTATVAAGGTYTSTNSVTF